MSEHPSISSTDTAEGPERSRRAKPKSTLQQSREEAEAKQSEAEALRLAKEKREEVDKAIEHFLQTDLSNIGECLFQLMQDMPTLLPEAFETNNDQFLENYSGHNFHQFKTNPALRRRVQFEARYKDSSFPLTKDLFAKRSKQSSIVQELQSIHDTSPNSQTELAFEESNTLLEHIEQQIQNVREQNQPFQNLWQEFINLLQEDLTPEQENKLRITLKSKVPPTHPWEGRRAIDRLFTVELHGIEAQMKEAREIFGRDFLGPEAVKNVWGVDLKPEEIPPIPFSLEELRRAKELNQFLILRINKDPQGQPLTIQRMFSLRRERGDNRLMIDENEYDYWYKNQPYYTTESPTFTWALVGKEFMDNPPPHNNENYNQQTYRIIQELQTTYQNQPLPIHYQQAIEQFTEPIFQANIHTILTNPYVKSMLNNYPVFLNVLEPFISSTDLHTTQENWKIASLVLSRLRITNLFRHSAPDILYDAFTILAQNNERLLTDRFFIWSKTRISTGHIVRFSDIPSFGDVIWCTPPLSRYGYLTLLATRSS